MGDEPRYSLRVYASGLAFMDIEQPDRLVTVQMTGQEKHGIFHTFSPPNGQKLPSYVVSRQDATTSNDEIPPSPTA